MIMKYIFHNEHDVINIIINMIMNTVNELQPM